jgi:hypothetical protein
MNTITQLLLDKLSGGGLSQISQQIGANEQNTSSALSMALPLLVSALAKNSSQPDGAQALHQALAKDHNGSILKDVSGYLTNPQAANGAGILEHVLGGQQPVVTQALAKGTGMQSDQIAQLLQIAAPLLLGILGKQQKKAGFDPTDLSNYLGVQKQKTQKTAPDMMSTLNTLLDSNGDGSAMDEIIGFAGKLFGK